MKKVIETKSSEDTEKLGAKIGRKLKGGETIELISDLGGGKTTLVRGLVSGVGSDDLVSSPTFTISNLYKTKSLEIHHFDFYRLSEAGLMEYDMEEELDQPDSVVVIEWSDVVAHVLPENRLTIKIESKAHEGRTITLTYPDSLKYLVENL